MVLTHRIRQQAGPQYPRRLQVFGTTQILWETSEVTRAANGVGQSPLMVLTHRIRQQAGSHSIRVADKPWERRGPSRPALTAQDGC